MVGFFKFWHSKQHFGRRKGSEECRQSSPKVRSIDKYKGDVAFKVNKGNKSNVEEKTNFGTLFCDENWSKHF